MPTAARAALARGMQVLHDQLSEVFRFGGVTFTGLTSTPQVADRGVPGGYSQGLEYDLEIEVMVSAFTAGFPKSGSTLFDEDGKSYQVAGFRQAPGSHKITLLVTQPST